MTQWKYPISWSRVSSALSCPRALQYSIDKTPPSFFSSNYYGFLGQSVQKVFELYFNNKLNQTQKGRSERTFQNLLKRYFKSSLFDPSQLSGADVKRFAMEFDGGRGLPVATPAQINRNGYLNAKNAEGRMSITSLAQFNAFERESDIISYIFYDDEERMTSEPKIGMLKSRWGQVSTEPISVFIESECRRIYDLTSGANVTVQAPASYEEEVEL